MSALIPILYSTLTCALTRALPADSALATCRLSPTLLPARYLSLADVVLPTRTGDAACAPCLPFHYHLARLCWFISRLVHAYPLHLHTHAGKSALPRSQLPFSPSCISSPSPQCPPHTTFTTTIAVILAPQDVVTAAGPGKHYWARVATPAVCLLPGILHSRQNLQHGTAARWRPYAPA